MNERHPLDIISLIFGILFLGISMPVLLLDTPLDIDARWALPATVIVVGLLILGSALRPKRSPVTTIEPSGDDFEPPPQGAREPLPGVPGALVTD